MRMDAFERYNRDPDFKILVDLFYQFLIQNEYTPTEIREAANVAACKQEMLTVRSLILTREEYDRIDPQIRAKMEGR